jgi:hypothetical protein
MGGALLGDPFHEGPSALLEEVRYLLMDESGAAVLLAGFYGGGIEDVKAPFPGLITELGDQFGYDSLRDGFDRSALEERGVRKELSGKKEGILG